MTVRELIEALQALPDEAKDLPVVRYCDWRVEDVNASSDLVTLY